MCKRREGEERRREERKGERERERERAKAPRQEARKARDRAVLVVGRATIYGLVISVSVRGNLLAKEGSAHLGLQSMTRSNPLGKAAALNLWPFSVFSSKQTSHNKVC